MDYNLDNFFLKIEENYLEEARNIFSSGKYRLESSEKNYYLIQYEDEKAETELLIGKKNIKASSCDCKEFHTKKVCRHIVAGLLIINQIRLTQPIKEKKALDPKIQGIKKLFTKSIIQELSEKELKQFILHATSQHALLDLEFKVRFAYKIDVSDPISKYLQILRNYGNLLGHNKWNSTKIKKLSQFIDQMIDIGEDLRAGKNLLESRAILLALLQYYCHIYRTAKDADLQMIYNNIHQYLTNFLNDQLPPTFRDQSIEGLRAIALAGSYFFQDPEKNIFKILYQSSTTSEKKRIWSDLQKYYQIVDQSDPVLFTYFSMAMSEQDMEQIQKLLIHKIQQWGFLRKIMDLAGHHPSGQWENQIAWIIFQNTPGPKIKNWAFEIIRQKETDDIKKIASLKKMILEQGRIDLLPDLRTISGSKWREIYRELVSAISAENKIVLWSALLLFEEDTQSLCGLIEEKDDLNLLLLHAPYLWERKNSFLINQLEQKISTHLDSHIGFQSAQLLGSIFGSLRQQGLFKLVDHLKKMIQQRYAERTHLIHLLKTSI